MKKLSLSIFLFIIISIVTVACDSKSNSINSISNRQAEGYTPKYTAERNDVMNKLKQEGTFKTALPSEYDLTATVQLASDKDADRIVYEIFIRKPKIEMSDLIMSFSLHPDMLPRLNTSDVFVSNSLNSEPIHYSPNSDTNGVSLYRGFVLDKALLDKVTLEIYKELYVKISYLSGGQKVVNYIKIQADPSADIQKYMTDATQ